MFAAWALSQIKLPVIEPGFIASTIQITAIITIYNLQLSSACTFHFLIETYFALMKGDRLAASGSTVFSSNNRCKASEQSSPGSSALLCPCAGLWESAAAASYQDNSFCVPGCWGAAPQLQLQKRARGLEHGLQFCSLKKIPAEAAQGNLTGPWEVQKPHVQRYFREKNCLLLVLKWHPAVRTSPQAFSHASKMIFIPQPKLWVISRAPASKNGRKDATPCLLATFSQGAAWEGSKSIVWQTGDVS